MMIFQFVGSVIGVIFGILLVKEYATDLTYAVIGGDSPRQFVAKSNIRREFLALSGQFLLLAVGVSYYMVPPEKTTLFDIFWFRQVCLIGVTFLLAMKSIILLNDRRRLIVLLSK